MTVKVKDKYFSKYISKKELNDITTRLASEIEKNVGSKNPLFVVMLNGAFVFASDFLRKMSFACETIFVRYSSYCGMQTTGHVVQSAIPEKVNGRHVVIIEDIVDSGLTMNTFKDELQKLSPASITIVSLLSKPSARKVDVNIDLIGKEIENKFVVGYGLDYDGYGRNLDCIYILNEN